MQAENLSYIIQAKSQHSDKWVKIFESTDYDKMSKFYKKIKNNVYIFDKDTKSFFLVSKEVKDVVFSYSSEISQISPSRWINIEAVDISKLSDKISTSLKNIETRFIEVVSQTRILNETKERV